MRQDNDDLHLPIYQSTEELAIAMKHEISQMGHNAIAEANTIIIRKKRKKGHKSNGWDKF